MPAASDASLISDKSLKLEEVLVESSDSDRSPSLAELFAGRGCPGLEVFIEALKEFLQVRAARAPPKWRRLLEKVEEKHRRRQAKSVKEMLCHVSADDLEELEDDDEFVAICQKKLTLQSRPSPVRRARMHGKDINRRNSPARSTSDTETSPPRGGLDSFLEANKKGKSPRLKPTGKGQNRRGRTKVSILEGEECHLTLPGMKDAPPRTAKRLPSMNTNLMDSWKTVSDTSTLANKKSLIPYLQGMNDKKNHKLSSQNSVVSGVSWNSGVSSLGMGSADGSIEEDLSTILDLGSCSHHTPSEAHRLSKESHERQSMDEALQGSVNIVEDSLPKRPARRRSRSPSAG